MDGTRSLPIYAPHAAAQHAPPSARLHDACTCSALGARCRRLQRQRAGARAGTRTCQRWVGDIFVEFGALIILRFAHFQRCVAISAAVAQRLHSRALRARAAGARLPRAADSKP